MITSLTFFLFTQNIVVANIGPRPVPEPQSAEYNCSDDYKLTVQLGNFHRGNRASLSSKQNPRYSTTFRILEGRPNTYILAEPAGRDPSIDSIGLLKVTSNRRFEISFYELPQQRPFVCQGRFRLSR